MIAPLRVIDAVEAAVTLPFEEGCRREREIAEQCLAGEEARALIHAFFAERAVSKVRGISQQTPNRLHSQSWSDRGWNHGRRNRDGPGQRRHSEQYVNRCASFSYGVLLQGPPDEN